MSAQIVISGTSCQLLNDHDVSFLRELDKELSFWVQGAEHSTAYRGFIDKNGKQVSWDGFKHLLSVNLKFSLGLLPRVKRFYEKHSRSYEIIDQRPGVSKNTPIDIISALIIADKYPYQYQLDAVRTALKNDRGIFRMATGSGKTITIALIAAELGKSTIIYVIGKDLLYQIHDLLTSLFHKKIGIIGDGKCEIEDINVATVWTIGQAVGLKKKITIDDEDDEVKLDAKKFLDIRSLLSKTKVHILDECHLAACDTIQSIFKYIKPEHIYGFSASPWRDDGADLLIENYLGEKLVDLGAKQLISEGYLVRPIIKFLSVPPYPHKHTRKKYQKIYSEYITDNDVRNEMIAKGAQKLVEQGFQTLVLFHNLNHGKTLNKLISEKIPCALLSGKDDSKRREEVKKQLESGKIKCVIASKIFDIGVDLPSLSGLITAGGGKSSVRALQRIGRVIRKHPGKTQAAVLDFADQAPYLFDHAKIRKEIYSQEFDVIWPGEEK